MSARRNETEEKRKQRLERIKLAAREKRANETPEQHQERLERRRLRQQNETPEQRLQRLQHEREVKRLRRENETPEERRHRIDKQFEANQRRKNKTLEERRRRLEQQKKYNQLRRITETPEERHRRLEKKKRQNDLRRKNETPEERRKRLEYQSKLNHLRRKNKTGEQAKEVYCAVHSQKNADAQIFTDSSDVQIHTLLTSKEVREMATQVESETLILPDLDTQMTTIDFAGSEFTSSSNSSSSTLKHTEKITVKTEPENVLFTNKEQETSIVDHNPNKQEEGVLSLLNKDIKKESWTDDSYGEEMERKVEIETYFVKEETNVDWAEEEEAKPQEAATSIDCTTSLYTQPSSSAANTNTQGSSVSGKEISENLIFEVKQQETLDDKTKWTNFIKLKNAHSIMEGDDCEYVNFIDTVSKCQALPYENSKDKNYKCMDCHKIYKTARGLKRHIQHVHEKILMYECMECQKTFSRKSHLQRHIDNVHSLLKKEKCNECNKKFFQLKELEYHINKVHKGVYECTECDKKYSRNDNLQYHINSVHRLSKHECKECNKNSPK